MLVGDRARGREEGKKLTWRDGVEVLWMLTRLRLRSGDWPVADIRSTPTRPQIMPPERR